MNHYISGKMIKELREKKGLTQLELASHLSVSDKTISKWECLKGYPDISLIEPLSKALGVSIIELMNGEYVVNHNKAGNLKKSHFSVCPICGNILYAIGNNINTCCGIQLPILEAEESDQKHNIHCEIVENEYFVAMNHEMTKEHYISFIAYVTQDRCEIVKLYPEQASEVRFLRRGRGIIYAYCNQDGLIKKYV